MACVSLQVGKVASVRVVAARGVAALPPLRIRVTLPGELAERSLTEFR
jgi:hypothetical protein